jgi:hypothetical protein
MKVWIDHMNHDHSSTSNFLMISEMNIMWALMALMAAHHFWMWKKSKGCHCHKNCKSKSAS